MHNVSAPTTTILPTTVSNFHSLNCFGYMIYIPQTSMHQNIAKSLTQTDIYLCMLNYEKYYRNCILEKKKETKNVEESKKLKI